MTTSPARRLLRAPVLASLEAEYSAAKSEYARAVARLSAAKAAVTAALDRTMEQRRSVRQASEAAALAAWLGGASTREVCELAGRKSSTQTVSSMVERFTHALLSHDELYGSDERWDEESDRRRTVLALERYRNTISLQEQGA